MASLHWWSLKSHGESNWRVQCLWRKGYFWPSPTIWGIQNILKKTTITQRLYEPPQTSRPSQSLPSKACISLSPHKLSEGDSWLCLYPSLTPWRLSQNLYLISAQKHLLGEQVNTGIKGHLCQPRAKPTSGHPQEEETPSEAEGSQCNTTFHYELSQHMMKNYNKT